MKSDRTTSSAAGRAALWLALLAVIMGSACGGGESSSPPTTDPSHPSPTTPQLTLVAGGGTANVDGNGSAAGFRDISGLAVDSAGAIFVADGTAIRKVTSNGQVSTLAGSLSESGTANGAGANARFGGADGTRKCPRNYIGPNCMALTITSAGDIWVADFWSAAIRRVSLTGETSTIAALGGAPISEPGATGTWGGPFGIAVRPSGEVRFLQRVRLDIAVPGVGLAYLRRLDGQSSRFVLPGSWDDGSAGLSTLAVDDGDATYLTDLNATSHVTLTKVAADGTVSSLYSRASSDGLFLGMVAAGTSGDVYFADTGRRVVRRISASGQVTTVVGTEGDVNAAVRLGDLPAALARPWALAVDRANKRLLIGDEINGAAVLLAAPLPTP